MGQPLHQRHFRFGYDDGTEATHTWRGLEDAAITMPADTPFLLRIAVFEEAGTSSNNIANQFQYRRNSGTWTNITTTSSVVKAVAVNAFTNGQNCTQRLTANPLGGAFEASAAGCTEDGNSGGGSNDIQANGCSETEAGLQIVASDVALGDTIEFRLTFGAVTAQYDVTPSLTTSWVPHVVYPLVGAMSLTGQTPTRTVAVPSPLVRIAYLAFETPDFSVAQYARPSADSVDGDWLNQASSNTDLYDSLNETTYSDTDYIVSGATPVDDSVKLKLSPIIQPKSGTITVRFRGKAG